MFAPLLFRVERECIGHIKLLLLNSLMLLLFLIAISVLLRFVGSVHLSVKGKLIGLTLLLLKNVVGPYRKKKKHFNSFCSPNFLPPICPDGSVACSPTDKGNLFGSHFANSSLSDSNAPDPPTQPLANSMRSIIMEWDYLALLFLALNILALICFGTF